MIQPVEEQYFSKSQSIHFLAESESWGGISPYPSWWEQARSRYNAPKHGPGAVRFSLNSGICLKVTQTTTTLLTNLGTSFRCNLSQWGDWVLYYINLVFANSKSESALRLTILSECAKFTRLLVALSIYRDLENEIFCSCYFTPEAFSAPWWQSLSLPEANSKVIWKWITSYAMFADRRQRPGHLFICWVLKN